MRPIASLLAVLTLSEAHAGGQTLTNNAAAATNSQALEIENDTEQNWSASVSVSSYVVPDDNYAQPTVAFDRDWLHLEARYNYEALETGSLWVGYNFSGGKKLAWEITPMLGGVFGETTGIAPGYEGSLSWWRLELYSEGEYVFDTGDSASSFFYSWSELTLAPVEWFQFGLVSQRTRVYQTDREIQWGPLVGFSYQQIDLTAYVLNPGDSQPTWVFSVAFNF